MSDDWQVGDLALCVRRPIANCLGWYSWSVKVGGVYIVIEVGTFEDGDLALNFAEDPEYDDEAGFEAGAFRKIRHHKPDEEDAETIRLLNGVKQPA